MSLLAEHKNRIVRRILDVTDIHTLQDIEAILGNETEITTTSGKKLSEKDYIDYINAISESIKNGEKTYSTEDVKSFVLNRNR
uniref:hypothetical protein n=1 Tax=Gelidibacter sp. TaxID=2018083 RepID=UPI0040492C3F